MIALATLLTLINQVVGTPYIPGGDSPAGTDCSELASWVSNAATARPVFGDRFNTGNEEAALAARGFQQGTAPNALVIGWNGHHTAVTLPDGTPVSSGEGGGVRVGGGGAYQPKFTHHMYLPMDVDAGEDQPPAPDEPVTVVITGLADPAKLTVHVSGTDLTLHEKTIKGSLFGSCNPQYDIVRLLRLYDAGQLMLDELVTTTYNLEQVNQGYQDLRDGKNIRGVIVH